MTNTSSKINDKRIRIVKKRINGKQIRITSKTRAVSELQKTRRAISHQPSTRRWSNQPIKSASWSERPITVARKQISTKGWSNQLTSESTLRSKKQMTITIKDHQIRFAGQEANGNRKPWNKPISIVEQKAKHNHYTNKISIANWNKMIMGTRPVLFFLWILTGVGADILSRCGGLLSLCLYSGRGGWRLRAPMPAHKQKCPARCLVASLPSPRIRLASDTLSDEILTDLWITYTAGWLSTTYNPGRLSLR